MNEKTLFNQLKNDLPASIVVFFVALPLCLGIALASGAPLFSGLIAGIIGGIVVGGLSGSHIGVSGPAAGLAVIVLTAIATLGDYQTFLLAVVLGGVLQIVLGLLKAGRIGDFFPSSVIKGMLSGIGIIIILKQIPHIFGYDADPEGDFAFFQVDGETTFSELIKMLDFISPGALLIAGVSLSILILWETYLSKKHKMFKLVQGPLVAVSFGILYYILTADFNSIFTLNDTQLVRVPVPKDISSFLGQFSLPNFAAITNYNVWVVAFTIAIVASLETLLCVEATDKLDPEKRVTPTNRELLAQGTGNIISGLIGGLPITQVIVRSSANIQSGGKTKLSAIIHGFFLLISVMLIPNILNMIPLAVLAAILLVVGYKLAKPALFKEMYQLGYKQFIPYIATILGIVFTDLLMGIGFGLAVSVVIILLQSYQVSHSIHKEEEAQQAEGVKMTFAEEVTFFNKAAILKDLERLPQNSHLKLDLSKTKFLDNDVVDILKDFSQKAKERNIVITLMSEYGIVDNKSNDIDFSQLRVKAG